MNKPPEMPQSPISAANLRILGCGLGGTALQALVTLPETAATAGPLIGPIGVIAASLASLGLNQIANRLDKKREVQEATRDLLTNRDVALAQGRAVEARLRKYARDFGKGSKTNEQRRLLAIAKEAETWWCAIVCDPFREELAKVRDDQIVRELAQYLSGKSEIILDEDTWIALLTEADRRTKGEPKLDAKLITLFARHLAGDFAHDFVEVLKTDLQTGGKAYAAVSLRFFGEILSGVRNLARTQENLQSIVDQLPVLLEQARTAIAALRTGGLPTEQESALSGTEGRLKDALAQLTQRVDEGFKEAPRLLADELERRQLVRTMLEFKSELNHFEFPLQDEVELIGRKDELELLDEMCSDAEHGPQNRRVLVFVGLGGEGKTALVGKWLAQTAAHGWPSYDCVFAWSFRQHNVDQFFKTALAFFDDPMASSPVPSIEKGRRLAETFAARRSLLVIDGLESLQYGPASPTRGELKEPGILAILRGIATGKCGRCIVTTQYSIPELRPFSGETMLERPLSRLSTEEGANLLRKFGIEDRPAKDISSRHGNRRLTEVETLVEDVRGHALTLNLFGSFLRDYHGGDIRKRDLVKIEEADAEKGGQAFRVMDAYVRAFMHSGRSRQERVDGRRALALLESVAIFDRPASMKWLDTLWTGKPIRGLTAPLFTAEWTRCGLKRVYHPISTPLRDQLLLRLSDAKLLTIHKDEISKEVVALDAHLMVREYFARRVREHRPKAWRTGHRRVYEHLRDATRQGKEPTLEDLEPLYQAIRHGCYAGLQMYALSEVYQERLLRRSGDKLEHYTWHALGAYASELGALGCFFETRWHRISATLPKMLRPWLLNEVGYCLQAVGRLTEALEPLRESARLMAEIEDWPRAATAIWNLTDLEVALGLLESAEHHSQRGMIYAERSLEPEAKTVARIGYVPIMRRSRVIHSAQKRDVRAVASSQAMQAHVLHLRGDIEGADVLFREAERMIQNDEPHFPLLYSAAGFHFCALLLAAAERCAWLKIQGAEIPPAGVDVVTLGREGAATTLATPKSHESKIRLLIESCRNVARRATETLKVYAQHTSFLALDTARDHLRRGQAALFHAILQSDEKVVSTAEAAFALAMPGLRHANIATCIPSGLINRALLRAFNGRLVGRHSAHDDLQEAWEIARRGPMPLFVAEIYLARARLFFRADPYPWNRGEDGTSRGAGDDLADARRLIKKHGYGRRQGELQDAERAILGVRAPE